MNPVFPVTECSTGLCQVRLSGLFYGDGAFSAKEREDRKQSEPGIGHFSVPVSAIRRYWRYGRCLPVAEAEKTFLRKQAEAVLGKCGSHDGNAGSDAIRKFTAHRLVQANGLYGKCCAERTENPTGKVQKILINTFVHGSRLVRNVGLSLSNLRKNRERHSCLSGSGANVQ